VRKYCKDQTSWPRGLRDGNLHWSGPIGARLSSRRRTDLAPSQVSAPFLVSCVEASAQVIEGRTGGCERTKRCVTNLTPFKSSMLVVSRYRNLGIYLAISEEQRTEAGAGCTPRNALYMYSPRTGSHPTVPDRERMRCSGCSIGACDSHPATPIPGPRRPVFSCREDSWVVGDREASLPPLCQNPLRFGGGLHAPHGSSGL
jgi:hypothetical protein